MNSPLEQIEALTRAMQETATQEDWERLAGQERLRVALARALDPDTVRTPGNQAALNRIVQDNALLVKRLSERRADIALLLGGLGSGLAGTLAPDR